MPQSEHAGIRLSAVYDGTGGVPVGGTARRILFAWYFNDVKRGVAWVERAAARNDRIKAHRTVG